jgi:Cft2 family RNA processing exonuclease
MVGRKENNKRTVTLMYVESINGEESLIITKREMEGMLKTFAQNEIRARQMLNEEKIIGNDEIKEVMKGALCIIQDDINLEGGGCDHDANVCICSLLESANELKNAIEKLPDAMAVATIHQEVKARGFKEAIEGLMYNFTGRMVNVDEEGTLI